MNITLIGPNLRDQSKGIFHVHAAGCRSSHGRQYDGAERMDLEVDTATDVIEWVYEDHAGDYGYEPGSPEFEQFIDECSTDFHFHACTGK